MNRPLHTRIASNAGSMVGVVFWLLVILLGVGGWIWNIVKIVAVASDPITGMFILRCIGIFVAPLGAILGFI